MGIGTAFFASLAFIYNWGQNPLLWRVFTPKTVSWGPGDHHALIMVTFGIIFFACIWKKVNPFFTFIGVYYYVEAYEVEWYLTYIPSRYWYHLPFSPYWLTATILSVPVLVIYVKLFGFPWKFWGFMVPMYLGWFAIGFPITNDFTGRTAVFFSLPVNGLEILTHIYVGIGFFLFIFPILKAKSDKISMKWDTDFAPLVILIKGKLFHSE